jgi:hypothetical protein
LDDRASAVADAADARSRPSLGRDALPAEGPVGTTGSPVRVITASPAAIADAVIAADVAVAADAEAWAVIVNARALVPFPSKLSSMPTPRRLQPPERVAEAYALFGQPRTTPQHVAADDLVLQGVEELGRRSRLPGRTVAHEKASSACATGGDSSAVGVESPRLAW